MGVAVRVRSLAEMRSLLLLFIVGKQFMLFMTSPQVVGRHCATVEN
jgi:hypothetical protein